MNVTHLGLNNATEWAARNRWCLRGLVVLLILALGQDFALRAQGLGPGTPAKEYIRLGDRIIAIENLAGVPAGISANGGTPQSTNINTAFPQPLSAKVTDSSSNPISGVPVTFTAVPASNGASGLWSGASTVSVSTNSSGIAVTATFQANSIAGSYVVNATVTGVATPATFNLTNVAGGAVGSITATGGTPQSATVGAAFASTLQATVKDVNHNILVGIVVTFTPPGSGASGTFAGGVNTATTNSSGIAVSPVFTANTTAGSYAVNASTGGFSAPFNLTNLPGPAASIAATQGTPQSANINTAFATALVAKVTDSYGNPVPNISVTFAAPTSGPSGTFGSSSTVTTLANGTATAPTFTANGTVGGPYTVTATAAGHSTNFSLTNTSPTYTLTGLVVNSVNGGALSGVSILLNNVPTTTTNTSGNYTISNLPGGNCYIITPSSPSYVFSPGNATFCPLNSNGNSGFVGYPGSSGTFMNPNTGSGNSLAGPFQFQTAPITPNTYPEIQILYAPSNSSTANACYVDWSNGGNNPTTIYLATNDGTSWVPPWNTSNFPLHTGSEVGGSWYEYYNSQCLLDMYNSYYLLNNNSPTQYWDLALYFFPSFGGSQQVWVAVNKGAWIRAGNWGVPNPAMTDANLNVTYPTNGGTVPKNTSFNLTGTITWTGSAGTGIRVFIDGGPSQAATITGPNFSFQTSVGAGTHQIAVATTEGHYPNQYLGTVVTLTVTGQ